MKRLILLLSLLLPAVGFAQQYSIDWYKVAGGGGTSTGGVYAVSGTIGQHDAGGPMTGRQLFAHRRVLGVDFRGANARGAEPGGFVCRSEQRQGFLAEHRQLHVAAKQQSRGHGQLDRERLFHHHSQRHEQHHHHPTDRQSVLSPEQSVNDSHALRRKPGGEARPALPLE